MSDTTLYRSFFLHYVNYASYVEICNITIFPVVLYMLQAWSAILTREYEFRVPNALRIRRPKSKWKGIRGRRKSDYKELYNLLTVSVV
jgi:hypothetical protein